MIFPRSSTETGAVKATHPLTLNHVHGCALYLMFSWGPRNVVSIPEITRSLWRLGFIFTAYGKRTDWLSYVQSWWLLRAAVKLAQRLVLQRARSRFPQPILPGFGL